MNLQYDNNLAISGFNVTLCLGHLSEMEPRGQAKISGVP